MSDPLTEPIMILHKIFICALLYFIGYKLYYVMAAYLWSFGLGFLNFLASIPIISPILYWICYGIYRISVYIILISLVVLFWIFNFWMLIIIFVPFVIIFPIPIFPFIFILPLKSLMLALIPPFKTLTDLGTLPLTYKIVSRLFSGELFFNFINYFLYPTGSDISSYLYYNANQIVQETSGYDLADYYKPLPKEDIDDEFKNQNDDYSGKTKDMKNLETNDDPKDIDTYKQYTNDPSISEGMKKIEEETQICVNVGQKFKPYNSSYSEDVKIDAENSFSPYNECYIKAIKSYLKTSIR